MRALVVVFLFFSGARHAPRRIEGKTGSGRQGGTGSGACVSEREKTEEERGQWGGEAGGARGAGARARERVTGGPGCGDPKSRIRHAAVYRS